MLMLRRATKLDLDFMTRVDLEDDGISTSDGCYSEADFINRRERLEGYLESDSDDAWVFEDQEVGKCIGLIIFRFRDLENEPLEEVDWVLDFLPRSLFPDDGRYTEIYQLWVDPDYRRRGLATQLKRQVEVESKRRSLPMIYTHTEVTNDHVIDMNLKLGYEAVRRGLIGDIDRVSLTKQVVLEDESV